jgi:Holliday junction DNA helicase RuvB
MIGFSLAFARWCRYTPGDASPGALLGDVAGIAFGRGPGLGRGRGEAGATMAIDRVVSAAASVDAPEDERANWSLRPTRLSEYVGQRELIGRLEIAIEAAKGRGDAMEHVLLHGPPGLGKTTLAYVIGAEMGTRVYVTSGPALTRPIELVAQLKQLQAGDVLFIDEIHRLPISVEEFVYPAMEDFRIDVQLDSGVHARTVQVPLAPFTLIGATTRAGLVSSPMRSRFGLTHHLSYYTQDELLAILDRSAQLLGVRCASGGGAAGGSGSGSGGKAGSSSSAAKGSADRGGGLSLAAIAARCRGTPRIANRLLRRVRDFAQVRADGVVTPDVVERSLKLEGVDALGLDALDRAYLTTIRRVFDAGPVGLEAVAATMNEDAGTLEDVVEPYLLQIGFLTRTRRGRAITRAATEHLGLAPPPVMTGGAEGPDGGDPGASGGGLNAPSGGPGGLFR